MNQVVVPHEIVNDETVTLVEWLAEEGQAVKAAQVVARLESSKGVIDVEAPAAGILRRQAKTGAELPIGAPLCAIASSLEELPPGQAAAPVTPPAAPIASPITPVVSTFPAPSPAPPALDPARHSNTPIATRRFSKAALDIVKARGIDPEKFTRQGLVTAARVLDFLGQAPRRAEVPPEVVLPPGPAALHNSSLINHPSLPSGVRFRSEELSRVKRAEVQFLNASHENVLPSLVSVLCETSGFAEAFRQPAAAGVSHLAVLVAETARLLRKYPALNAFFREGKTHYYEEINVGFALDAGLGLKVPVVRAADTKTAAQIEVEIKDFVFAYLEKNLPVSAMAGGTFTITDLSGEGAFGFLPLINQWQGAILGLGAEFLPSGAGSGFYQLLVGFDHQIAEGRVASAFLQDLRHRLAAYERALRPPAGSAAGAGQAASSAKPVILECSRCGRPADELEQLRGFLLERLLADGSKAPVCSLCVGGY
jgi:pyruvate/2-oxoglutarate dehydrogenase complex dihydrolipoamide acyltransferase (E2) component